VWSSSNHKSVILVYLFGKTNPNVFIVSTATTI